MSESAAWRLASISILIPRTLSVAVKPNVNKAGSMGKRTRFGVHFEFQILCLPVGPAPAIRIPRNSIQNEGF